MFGKCCKSIAEFVAILQISCVSFALFLQTARRDFLSEVTFCLPLMWARICLFQDLPKHSLSRRDTALCGFCFAHLLSGFFLVCRFACHAATLAFPGDSSLYKFHNRTNPLPISYDPGTHKPTRDPSPTSASLNPASIQPGTPAKPECRPCPSCRPTETRATSRSWSPGESRQEYSCTAWQTRKRPAG